MSEQDKRDMDKFLMGEMKASQEFLLQGQNDIKASLTRIEDRLNKVEKNAGATGALMALIVTVGANIVAARMKLGI